MTQAVSIRLQGYLPKKYDRLNDRLNDRLSSRNLFLTGRFNRTFNRLYFLGEPPTDREQWRTAQRIISANLAELLRKLIEFHDTLDIELIMDSAHRPEISLVLCQSIFSLSSVV